MPPPLEIRLDFPFTQQDAPETRARIESDLRRVAHRAHDADPKLRALALTGGFSRGEGSVRDGAPVNDYDLIAIRANPGGDALYAPLGEELTRETGIEVDLLPIWDQRLPWVARKLFWLDVRLGARVLTGDSNILERLRRFDARQLERAEIARLLGNRAAGLLLALPTPGEPPDRHARDLQATKAILAAMDAALLARGEYAPSLRQRLALAQRHPEYDTFRTAVEWKLRPHPALPDDWWERARDTLLRAVDATRAHDAEDGLPERIVHALRARKLARAPSQTIRYAAWELLRSARFPDGPHDLDGLPWGFVKPRFFAARRMTLQ